MNRLFAGLEGAVFFVINICIVSILWIGGNRIGDNLHDGDENAGEEKMRHKLFRRTEAEVFDCPGVDERCGYVYF